MVNFRLEFEINKIKTHVLILIKNNIFNINFDENNILIIIKMLLKFVLIIFFAASCKGSNLFQNKGNSSAYIFFFLFSVICL